MSTLGSGIENEAGRLAKRTTSVDVEDALGSLEASEERRTLCDTIYKMRLENR
jgi:hypothetical protein